jgi:hypothetical protein
MAKDFADFEAEQRRLMILQILAKDSDYEVNEDMLLAALEAVGLAVSAEDLRNDLYTLKMEVCIMVREVGSLWIIKLTKRGHDVSRGLISAQGVAKPRPGSV